MISASVLYTFVNEYEKSRGILFFEKSFDFEKQSVIKDTNGRILKVNLS